MSQAVPARDDTLLPEASVPQTAASPFPEVPERPALAPDVQLCGPMESGFAERQWLVQRAGIFIQLPEVFYRVAEQANGTRTVEELAEAVSAVTGSRLRAEHIRLIVGAKLIPKGIVVAADSDASARRRSVARPPLAMRVRTKMISPAIIDPITRVLQVLFVPPVLIAVLVLVAISHGWLYLVHGLKGNLSDILSMLSLMPGVLPLNILAAAFHELGHAAALRYGGGKVRGIGAGLYLIYPVFFTDVTDNYRLSRWDRVRTDLGGFYFTLIFTLAMIAIYLITGQELFLLIVFLLDAEILFQSLPFVRFDGYWILADLTGIPDFFSQMGAFLRAIVPLPRWKGYRLPKLKGWVQLVFGLYIVVTGPLLAFLLFRILQTLPDVLTVTWSSLSKQRSIFSAAVHAGDTQAIAVSTFQSLLLALPTAGLLLIVMNAGRTFKRALWKWTKRHPARGALRVIGTAIILGFVAFLWLPQESLTLLPLRRVPQSIMAVREAVWDQVGALSGRHQAGDIGNLVLVTTLALIALELCFVLFDLINLAATAVQTRWQKHRLERANQTPRGQETMSPGVESPVAHQEHPSWLSYVATELAQAGKTDREIQDLLITAGLDADAAALIATNLSAGRLKSRQQAVRQVIASGAIVSTLGTLVTLGAWWAGVNSGIILLAGCAAVIAGVRVVRGLIQTWLLRTSTPESGGLTTAVRRVGMPLQQRAAWSVAGLLMLGSGYGLWEVYRDDPRAAVREAAVAQGAARVIQPDTPGSATAQAATGTSGGSERKEMLASTTGEQSVSEATGGVRQSADVDAPRPQSGALSSPAAIPPLTTAPGNLPVPAPAQSHATSGADGTSSTASTADGVVRADRAALHTGPGDQYPVVRELPAHAPLEIVGQAVMPPWFKVRLRDGTEGWIADDLRLVQLNRPRADIPRLVVRPATGMVYQHLPLTGVGELQIANAAGKDGLVTMARAGQHVASIYVRAGEIYTLRGIPDGRYTIVTSQGEGWDGNSFTRNVNPKRVEELVTFETTAQEYTVWEISLVDGSTN